MGVKKLSIKLANKALISKDISALELTKLCIENIKKNDQQICSFITPTVEQALTQAKKIDHHLSQNQTIPLLAGIPTSIKDVIVTEGVRTTAGSKILENFTPPYDATVVRKLKDKNAIIVGKTNCDEFAMGSSTENSAYKITKNPHDLSCVPGGSSGGSAAAVTSGFCLYSLGSDTGGSIRQPASLCGVVGFKPTYGLVSRYGLIAMGSSLDQIGPITKTVEDAAIVLSAIAGYDPNDSTSAKIKIPDYTKQLGKSIKGLKVGVAKEYFSKGLDKIVRSIIEKALKKLEQNGAKIVEISLPHQEYAVATYYLIMPSEVSANLARYDGIRYGKNREYFGDEPKRRIILGTYVLSSGYYDQYYSKAAKVRNLIKADFEKAFSKVDVIAGPTSPTVAWKIGEKIDDPMKMYLSDIYTIPANLAGIPAISIPAGYSNNLPIGLQIMGPHFREELILQVAYAYEQETTERS